MEGFAQRGEDALHASRRKLFFATEKVSLFSVLALSSCGGGRA